MAEETIEAATIGRSDETTEDRETRKGREEIQIDSAGKNHVAAAAATTERWRRTATATSEAASDAMNREPETIEVARTEVETTNIMAGSAAASRGEKETTTGGTGAAEEEEEEEEESIIRKEERLRRRELRAPRETFGPIKKVEERTRRKRRKLEKERLRRKVETRRRRWEKRWKRRRKSSTTK